MSNASHPYVYYAFEPIDWWDLIKSFNACWYRGKVNKYFTNSKFRRTGVAVGDGGGGGEFESVPETAEPSREFWLNRLMTGDGKLNK